MYTEKMEEIKKMLLAVMNGQSAMKDELLAGINNLEKRMDSGFAKTNSEF